MVVLFALMTHGENRHICPGPSISNNATYPALPNGITSSRSSGRSPGQALFPHWFAANFRKYNDKEAEMPFDQHFALATIAPRPLLVCSATEDLWADPKGEFLAAQATTPVYKLFGKEGMTASEQPGPDKLIDSIVGYNLRTGKHDVTLEDWKSYIAFANKQLPKP